MIIEPGGQNLIGCSVAGAVAGLVISDQLVDKRQIFISTRLNIFRNTLGVCMKRVGLRDESGSDPKVAARLRREYLPAPIVREISVLYAIHRQLTGVGSKLMLEEVAWFGDEFVRLCKQVQDQKSEILDGVSMRADLAQKIVDEWHAMCESLEKMWRTAC